jgi:hypothetical protein
LLGFVLAEQLGVVRMLEQLEVGLVVNAEQHMAEEPQVHVQYMQEAHSEPVGHLDKVTASMGLRLALLVGDTAADNVQWVATDSDSLAGIGTGGHWEGALAGHFNLLKGAPLG